MKDIRDYNLKNHNTFGIDVKCRRFLEFSDVGELKDALASLSAADRPLLMIGQGSNLLFTGDYNGTVLHSAIKGHEASHEAGHVLLRCGSGEVWDDIVSLCVSNGWYGLENLSLIPGEVGASAVQNIGAYGVEVETFIHSIEAVEIATGKIRMFDRRECDYAYRWSKFKGEWRGKFVITHVTYCLPTVFNPNLEYGNITSELQKLGITHPNAQQLRDVVIEIRKAKLPDPLIEGNAGSFFMNPIVPTDKYEQLAAEYGDVPHYPIDDRHVKIPAGWMIDRCGWKGKSLGKAGVHSRQALVLVNRGGASGADVLRLCEAIRGDVSAKFGIDIKPEVNII